MEHRHINTKGWTAATVDSALERGSLKDWQELFDAVERNVEVAELILRVVSEREPTGASALARSLVMKFRPELGEIKVRSRDGRTR
jgi:hypothetical protein